ncbi:MAG: hypothetical protein ACE5LU_05260 [Anaerolineae bacterium]
METEKDPTTEPAEIVVGLQHMLIVVALLVVAILVAGFGWWTLSTISNAPETAASQSPAPTTITYPAAGRETARLAAPAIPTRRPARQMALPPVRENFVPKPEATSVKGDPNAPVTIVEFSDYQ